MKETLERVLLAVNIGFICLLGFLAFRAGGPGRAAVVSWVAERRSASAVHRRWPELSASGNRLDTASTQVLLVEFADYECPFCRQGHPVVQKLVRENPMIGVAYVQFPLPSHRAARGAARAALCAGDQGRFLSMHRRLLETDAWEADTNWMREAATVGVPDPARFAACIRNPLTDRRIDVDLALGTSLGVNATPTFFSIRGVLRGLPEESTLVRLARGR